MTFCTQKVHLEKTFWGVGAMRDWQFFCASLVTIASFTPGFPSISRIFRLLGHWWTSVMHILALSKLGKSFSPLSPGPCAFRKWVEGIFAYPLYPPHGFKRFLSIPGAAGSFLFVSSQFPSPRFPVPTWDWPCFLLCLKFPPLSESTMSCEVETIGNLGMESYVQQ